MNRRYIDFVPVKHRPVEHQVPVEEIEGEDSYEEPEPVEVYHSATIREYENDDNLKGMTVEEILLVKEEETEDAKTFEPQTDFGLGMVEDYVPVSEKRPAFINTAQKIEKRPLGLTPEEELKLAKSEDLTKRSVKRDDSPAEAPKPQEDSAAEFKKPKFINTHLIEKRPLSKTDYRNRIPVAAAEETPDGPVTIIDKPDKDSRLGFILTIIITILLGAAVGTVAFLLIPK